MENKDFMYVEPSIDGFNGINRNFCSSLLFLVPAVYGYLIAYPAVMGGFFDEHCLSLYEGPKPILSKNRHCVCQ
jgi:hypothetical protein